jgi:hypothetical protein
MLESPERHCIDLAVEVAKKIQAETAVLNKEFANIAHTWLDETNKLIIGKTGFKNGCAWNTSKHPMSPQ